MRVFIYIATIVSALLMGSCRPSSALFGFGPSLAKVGGTSLTAEDIRTAMPSGLTGADSAGYTEAYIEKWVVKQLKLQEAELLFPEAEEDIDRKVEEYRQSLLIRKVEQYYLDTAASLEITDKDIAAYYERHKGDFRLAGPVVRGEIVAFGDSYRSRDRLKKLMASDKGEERRDFEALCRKNNFRLTRFEEWVDFAEFLGNLPLVRSATHDALLAKRGVQQIHHNRTYYCFRITDALGADEPMPLYMVRDNIRRIITNQRQVEIIRSHEERMMHEALENGHARIRHREAEAEEGGNGAKQPAQTR